MKTKHIGKRMLAIFFALAFCLTLLPVTAMAASGKYYEKVTTPEAGKNYLIVYANGGSGFALKNNGGSVSSVPVTITNDKIELDDNGAVWAVSGSTDLQFTNNGQKIGGQYTTLRIASSFNYPESADWRYSGTTLANRGAGENKLACNNSGNFSLAYNGSAITFYEEKEKQDPDPVTPTVDSVTVTPATASVAVGATTTLSATVNGSEGVSQVVTWSTANPGIATVNDSGVVTGVGVGEIAITATSKDDNTKFGTCMVTVTAATVPVTGVTLDQHNLTLTAGGAPITLTATVAPENATDKSLTWLSGDASIATVVDGVVTPVGEGTVAIGVASVNNPAANDICNVTVEAAPAPAGKTYELKDTIQDGKNYLIVSSNAAGSAFALKNENGVASAAVEIADGKITANDDSIVWKATGSASSFTLENGTGAFLQRNTDDLGIGDTATSWNWQYAVPMNGDRALTYNNGFVLTFVPYEAAIANNKVYFFEETGEPAPVTPSVTIIGDYPNPMTVGDTYTFTASVSPSTEVQTVTWSSVYENVATVDPNTGLVTAVGVGSTSITATWTGNPDVWMSVGITVNPPAAPTVDSVTITPPEASVNVGETVQLSATVSGSAGVSQEVTWETGDGSVATVDGNGVVSGVSAGAATITATSKADPTKFATCIVTVNRAPAPTPTAKTYKLVTDVKDGNYLIVSTDRNGDASALTLSEGAFGKEAVRITNSEITYEGTAAIWAVSGTSSSFELSNGGTRIGAYPSYAADNLAVDGAAGVSQPDWDWKINNTKGAICGNYERGICWNGSNFVFGDRNAGGNSRVYFFEEQAAAEPSFTTNQLVLSGQIGVIFNMDLSMLSADQLEDSAMEFEVASEEGARAAVTYDAYDATTGIATYTCFVNALQMADEITATFTYDNDNKEVVATASVRDYIDDIIAKGSDPAYSRYVGLAKAIGDYGHYAQIYLADAHGFTVGGEDGKYAAMPVYNSDLGINAAREGVADFAPIFDARRSAVTKAQMKLSLDSATALSIRAVAPADVNISGEIYIPNPSSPSDLVASGIFENGIAKIENIKPIYFGAATDNNAKADGEDFTIKASVLSYAYVVLNNTSSDTKLTNLAAALYNYYQQARSVN